MRRGLAEPQNMGRDRVTGACDGKTRGDQRLDKLSPAVNVCGLNRAARLSGVLTG